MTTLDPLDHQICFTVYTTNLAIARAYKPLLDRLGLTYPQYLVLSVLHESAPRTIGAIAGELHLESSTVTPLVKRLEAAGLVARRRDSGDERRLDVTLTEAGRTLLAEATCLGDHLLDRSAMTAAALDDLNDRLKALRAALNRR